MYMVWIHPQTSDYLPINIAQDGKRVAVEAKRTDDWTNASPQPLLWYDDDSLVRLCIVYRMASVSSMLRRYAVWHHTLPSVRYVCHNILKCGMAYCEMLLIATLNIHISRRIIQRDERAPNTIFCLYKARHFPDVMLSSLSSRCDDGIYNTLHIQGVENSHMK